MKGACTMRQRRSAALLCCVVGLTSLIMSPPAHAGVIEVNEWNNLTEPGWVYNTGQCGCGGTVDTTANSPAGGGVFRSTFMAQNATTSVGGGTANFTQVSGRDIYVGHWVKWSPGFTWNPIGTKIDYQWVALNSTATGATNAFTIRVQPGGYGFALDITIQGNGAVLMGLPHTVYNNTGGSMNFQTGRWYWLEYHTKLNDVTGSAPATLEQIIANGVLEVWVDDVLKASYSNLRFVDKPGQSWANVLHSPEWGGGGGLIPVTQYTYFDHTVISTTRIGRPAVGGDTTAPGRPTNFVVN